MIFSSSEISNIISNFSITGKLIKVKKLHSGTVNLSFKISISYKNVIKHYVLQKINKIQSKSGKFKNFSYNEDKLEILTSYTENSHLISHMN